MQSRFTVTMCIYGGSRRKVEIFVRETSLSLVIYFSRECWLSKRHYCNVFCDCNWEFERGIAGKCGFLLAVSSRWFRSYYCWSVTVVTVV